MRSSCRALALALQTVWGNPGTRLGLWSHFTSQFSVTVFSLLWGFPFLVRGEGLSDHGTASTLLIVMTGAVIVSGWLLGRLTSRAIRSTARTSCSGSSG